MAAASYSCPPPPVDWLSRRWVRREAPVSLPRLIVSLFDFTGNWCRPYREAGGYEVHQVDVKLGSDVRTYQPPRRPWGVLAAPPCTIWTNAAAHMWRKVPPSEFEAARLLVFAAVEICRSAESFWCLENPRGRLGKIIGLPHVWEFTPSDYGDPWSKRTCLWGRFNPPWSRLCLADGPLISGHSSVREYPLFGQRIVSRGWHKFPKKFGNMTAEEKESRRTWRSTTPPGFARAFFEANP